MRTLLSIVLAAPFFVACETADDGDCTEVSMITAYRDEDLDGHADPSTHTKRCTVNVGKWVSTGLDCDDTRESVNPDQIEELSRDPEAVQKLFEEKVSGRAHSKVQKTVSEIQKKYEAIKKLGKSVEELYQLQ